MIRTKLGRWLCGIAGLFLHLADWVDPCEVDLDEWELTEKGWLEVEAITSPEYVAAGPDVDPGTVSERAEAVRRAAGL